MVNTCHAFVKIPRYVQHRVNRKEKPVYNNEQYWFTKCNKYPVLEMGDRKDDIKTFYFLHNFSKNLQLCQKIKSNYFFKISRPSQTSNACYIQRCQSVM